MSNIVELIKAKDGFVALEPASKEQIKEAEKSLGLSFAKEYVEYVSELGATSFVGHELTGVCSSKRLNVVEATINAREDYECASDKMYLLEDMHIDGITIWQIKNGSVYKIVPNEKAEKIADSLAEYIKA